MRDEPSEFGHTTAVAEEEHDLAGPEAMRRAGHFAWYPAEVDVSIRPGWFHHASQDTAVKSLPRLMDLYRHSVGRNAVLLLNVPPDRRGLFADPDVARLTEFGRVLREVYGVDLAADAHTGEDVPGSVLVELPQPRTFNVVGLSEDIRHGQLVESFAVDVWLSGAWQRVATGTTVGHRRLVTLPRPLTSHRLRVRVLASRAAVRPDVSLMFDPTVPQPVVHESFAAARDSRGISGDDAPGLADLGGTGISLSAQALAAAGIVPGGTVAHGGLAFRWPATAPGEPDNVRADGQTITMSGSGSRIGFLLLGTADRSFGPGLATYTDGSRRRSRCWPSTPSARGTTRQARTRSSPCRTTTAPTAASTSPPESAGARRRSTRRGPWSRSLCRVTERGGVPGTRGARLRRHPRLTMWELSDQA
ncbi:hypothetical protein SALBM311S_01692 [Streptomyces alboniger]